MSYPTVAYPEWGTLDPKIHEEEVSEFVETAVWASRDLFDDYHDIHEPEIAAVGAVKRATAYAAIAVDQEADDTPTIGDFVANAGERAQEVAEDRGVLDVEVTAADIAYAAYARTVTGFDWGASMTELDEETFVFLHDDLHQVRDAGKDVWGDAE